MEMIVLVTNFKDLFPQNEKEFGKTEGGFSLENDDI